MFTAKASQTYSTSSISIAPFVETEDHAVHRSKGSNVEATYPLSSIQQGMLFHHRYEPHSGVDIEQVVCRLQENLEVERFVQAWQQLVDRHPILRTRFSWNAQNEPIQQVLATDEITFQYHDWQSLTAVQQVQQFGAFLRHDRQSGFDFSGSLMRFTLFQAAPNVYQFVWTFHHILLDGRSITQILQEVFALYDNPAHPLPARRSYQDYIEKLQQQDWSHSKSYWQDLLKGFTTPTPLLNAPSLHQTQTRSGHGTARLSCPISLTAQLKSFTEQHNITPNTLVQAAWALLLHRYSNETSIVFGATRACRRSLISDGDSIIGLMMNTLPVRVDIDDETTVLPWLQALRSQHLAVRPHENTPLSLVQDWSDVPRGTGLFESIVVFEHQNFNDRLKQGTHRTFKLIEQPSFPLVLIASLGTTLELQISYDREKFTPETIKRMLDHLQVLLDGMIANPQQSLSDLPLITASERHQLLFDWNATTADYQTQQCVHQLFEAQVEKAPNAIAAVFQQQSLTYAELNQQANQIAHHLRSLGVGAGQFVAVFLDRRLEMIPALLGILKAGAAYIPLETSFPPARVEWILGSLAVSVVITQVHHIAMFEPLHLRNLKQLVCLDATYPVFSEIEISTQAEIQQCSIENLPLHCTSEDTAYVIFTSGSTGTPKGVVVKHKPVINLIEWVNRTFNVNHHDRVLFITSLCFDLSVYDIFGLLAAGGSIQIASSDDVRDPQVLINLLKTEPITFWDSAPPALQQLSSLFPSLHDCPSSLRLVFMSGDWIPVTLPTALQATFPGVEVVSLGGATEATVWSNYYRIDRVEPHWKSIPYGKPIQNAQYYVLDAKFNPCPIGVTGELYIAGDCLAVGYTDPVKTEERFLPNPFVPGTKIYRTGDLARFFEDGNIEFLGRIDHQVKVRGYRIELGEIEGVLSQHQLITDAIVMAREDQPGDKRLVAYVVAQSKLDANGVRQHLREKLPEYMVPSAIVFLDAIPLTQNGKVDRRALPMPEAVRVERSDVIELTESPLERQLMFMWEKALDIQPIATTDNFFDLGGNSLTAVKLINQMEKAFGRQFSVASLFQAPTIEQFAEIIRDGQEIDPWAVIEINPLNEKKPPLFWCQNYGDLIPHLDPDQPFFALESGYQQVKNPETHIKGWAAGYVDRIRDIQPEGPYFIGGYCFGGYIALEIAQILRSQGQEVALLTLVETFGPDVPYYQRQKITAQNLVFYTTSIRRRILGAFDRHWHALEAQKSAQKTGGRVVKVTSPPDKPIQRAVQSYDIQPYDGRVVMFEAALSTLKSRFAPRAFWDNIFKGDFTIERVKGTHYTVVYHNNGRDLMQRIQGYLEQYRLK
jgi:amino acid adenylation domain-containing protein